MIALEEATPEGKWQLAGDYDVWTARRAPGEPVMNVVELHGGDIVADTESPSLLHVTRPGVPFRISHGFGYWRIGDVDTLFMRLERTYATYYGLMIGGDMGGKKCVELMWRCSACVNELRRAAVELPTRKNAEFLKQELPLVRAFNGGMGAGHRLCAKCGTEHPIAYGFNAPQDNAAEAQARRQW